MKAPAGAEVALYYDGHADEGDYLRTPSGRTYLLVGVRVQERGKNAGRLHLRAVVMAADHTPEPDARVRLIHWYRRERRR